MRKIIPIICLLLSITGVNAQPDFTVNKKGLVLLLEKHLFYKDSNPIWQEDADKVNQLFGTVLNHFENYTSGESETLRSYAFELLYDNSIAVYEDMTDVDRMSKRRMLCFLSLSLLSDSERYASFLNDATHCVDQVHREEKELNLILIDLLALYLLSAKEDVPQNGRQMEEKYKEIYKKVELNQKKLKKDFTADFYEWTKK